MKIVAKLCLLDFRTKVHKLAPAHYCLQNFRSKYTLRLLYKFSPQICDTWHKIAFIK